MEVRQVDGSTSGTAGSNPKLLPFEKSLLPFFKLFITRLYYFCILTVLFSAAPTNSFDSGCGFTDCWELYQLAQESLRISDEYPLTWVSKHKEPASSLSSTELEKRCTAFRTFYKCLAEANRGCLGDLNFHSAQKGIEKQMKLYDCSPEGPVFEQQFPLASPIPLACTYEEVEFSEDMDFHPGHKVCGIFGNLHLRMFDGKYQTCNIIGAWPVIDNDHLTIQVTAEKHHMGSVLSKVTVVVKQDEDCALADRYVLYQASIAELPSTFDDGSTVLGAFDSIKLNEIEPNQHVQITMRHIDTTISIHHVQYMLSVFVRTPDEFAKSLDARLESIQLCFIGCPASAQVDMKYFIKTASSTQYQVKDGSEEYTAPSSATSGSRLSSTLPQSNNKPEAISYESSFFICRSYEPFLKGYFLDSCIYDVMSSGDSGLVTLSALAMNETVALSEGAEIFEEPAEPNVRRHVSNGTPIDRPCSVFVIFLFVLTQLFLLNHSTTAATIEITNVFLLQQSQATTPVTGLSHLESGGKKILIHNQCFSLLHFLKNASINLFVNIFTMFTQCLYTLYKLCPKSNYPIMSKYFIAPVWGHQIGR